MFNKINSKTASFVVSLSLLMSDLAATACVAVIKPQAKSFVVCVFLMFEKDFAEECCTAMLVEG